MCEIKYQITVVDQQQNNQPKQIKSIVRTEW